MDDDIKQLLQSIKADIAGLSARIGELEAEIEAGGAELAKMVHEDIIAGTDMLKRDLASKSEVAALREELARQSINIRDTISMTGKSLLDAYDDHVHPHTHPDGCNGPAEAA
jgi:hypothetical protein